MPNNYCNIEWVNDAITTHNGYTTVNHSIEPISSSNWSSLNYVTVSDSNNTIVGTRTFNTNIWKSPDNPYYDYVSDINSIIGNLKVVEGQLYDGENLIGYDELCDIVTKLSRIVHAHNDLETRSEPPLSGEEYNE